MRSSRSQVNYALYPYMRNEVRDMDHMNPAVTHEPIDDETMLRHIAYCGVIVTFVALGIAWVANTVA